MKHSLHKVLTVFIITTSALIAFSAATYGQIISTYAGNGIPGYSGNNGQATAAELNGPSGLAEDTAGSIYISDVFNNVIRKITKAGVITTVAGNGLSAYSGDGGQATAAQFTNPTGVALDNAGNIYIADNGNHRIRKVDISTHIITTIAGTGVKGFSGDGGAATNADLYNPDNLVVDASGTIFFSDYGNRRVRKISGGTISTVAGDGTAGFAGDGGPATNAQVGGPEGLAVDDSGNIYIADYANNRIRKVTSTTGIITTVAGNGTGSWGGDGGAATAAELQTPTGVALDDLGNLIISDFGNNVIRKVSGGIISTIAGNDSQGFSGDGGAATDAQLNKPNDIITDTAGSIYIADLGNNRIRKVAGCQHSLNVGPASPSVCSGESVTLTATGGTTYTWSPGNGLSATTGDSVVANPTATTTYTVVSTTGGCSGIGTEVVTIIPSPTKPTITVSTTGDSLISSATQGNQWYFNDTLLVDSTNQVIYIKGHRYGFYTVKVINPANGCSTTSDSTDGSSGINEIAIRNKVTIFPNPTNSNVTVQINQAAATIRDWSLQLTDELGRMLFIRSTLNRSNTIDVTNLPNGVYLISVITKTGSAVFPVVRQN